MFAGDRELIRAFMDEAELPAVSDVPLPKFALASVLLHGADQLSGMPGLDECNNLDDLSTRLFGEP